MGKEEPEEDGPDKEKTVEEINFLPEKKNKIQAQNPARREPLLIFPCFGAVLVALRFCSFFCACLTQNGTKCRCTPAGACESGMGNVSWCFVAWSRCRAATVVHIHVTGGPLGAQHRGPLIECTDVVSRPHLPPSYYPDSLIAVRHGVCRVAFGVYNGPCLIVVLHTVEGTRCCRRTVYIWAFACVSQRDKRPFFVPSNPPRHCLYARFGQ